ncbi:MazG nucleotide pyrophosphohydrolase domain-containing protein [Clostridium magnum]|uniref:NTP pyrophosphohydrolase MazG-like domain-containing protein n=1 Tax=Clostridium magnum DSM 2767 TaxID=1121326 RepID=A0A161W0N4_9CLOT|nr:MazG nucleotide pyrophosphohydrolase domain-containing protein [Clostridium magnum]KZL88670.1 hypothetical protein CLMAG_59590 [Clostridium magnum DSM 2767]KZL88760.1 hypothetical protein CLMAG_60490 [Clostridium magnum DSM 2767]SHJ60466.1 MazG nucleotide pyrophosphohydrolase domain-containing protein [Clostridium magnum DSM 2767]
MVRLFVLKKVKGHDGKVIDNTKVTWEYWKKKLKEEVEELIEAIDLNDKTKIMEEVLDVIQVGVGMVYKLFKEGMIIEQGIHRHNKKLTNRWCEVAATIRLHITKN